MQYQIAKRDFGEVSSAVEKVESAILKDQRRHPKKASRESASNQILTAFWQKWRVCGTVV
jgi:hypothetical protein